MKWFIIILCIIYAQATVNYYKILEISKGASERDIKQAYHKLAIIYHPDKNFDNAQEAEVKFIQLTTAYETLSDPAKRAVYDEQQFYAGKPIATGRRHTTKSSLHKFGKSNIFDPRVDGGVDDDGDYERVRSYRAYDEMHYMHDIHHLNKQQRQQKKKQSFYHSTSIPDSLWWWYNQWNVVLTVGPFVLKICIVHILNLQSGPLLYHLVVEMYFRSCQGVTG